jgi:hypothetical protein
MDLAEGFRLDRQDSFTPEGIRELILHAVSASAKGILDGCSHGRLIEPAVQGVYRQDSAKVGGRMSVLCKGLEIEAARLQLSPFVGEIGAYMDSRADGKLSRKEVAPETEQGGMRAAVGEVDFESLLAGPTDVVMRDDLGGGVYRVLLGSLCESNGLTPVDIIPGCVEQQISNSAHAREPEIRRERRADATQSRHRLLELVYEHSGL